MARDLYNRLKHLREQGAGPRPREAGGAASGGGSPGPQGGAETAPVTERSGDTVSPGGAPPGLEGWRELAPLVYVRETRERISVDGGLSGPDADSVLEGAAAGGAAATTMKSRLVGRPIAPGELCFMDTETTGLSGGAGTTVFLVGAGVFRQGELLVRQVLLADFPGEPEFLQEVQSVLAPGVWVSYNGKAFDARLLESRYLMNGIAPPAKHHVDLLYWARRLWRSRIGSCSLDDLEREVLARGREDDVPGMEIPERYFRFLREGDATPLEGVFEHHRLDIVSLAHLFLRIESILSEPAADPTVDRFQLGRWLLASNDMRGRDLLRSVVEAGDRRRADQAAVLVARTLRREGRPREALEVLGARGGWTSSLRAVEAAKVFEHDLRDPSGARSVVEALLAAVPQSQVTPDLLHRLARLQRKTLRS